MADTKKASSSKQRRSTRSETSRKRQSASSGIKKTAAQRRKRSSAKTSLRSRKKKRSAKGTTVWIGAGIFALAVLLVLIGYCLGKGCDTGASKNPFENPDMFRSAMQMDLPKTVEPSKKKRHSPTAPTHRKKSETIASQPSFKASHTAESRTIKQTRKGHKEVKKTKPAVDRPTETAAKPMLAIIIDDVHTATQIRRIQAIGYPVTPSIFPPYSLSPHTERLTSLAAHYMIHLPMESGSAKLNRQTGTLMRTFDEKRIDKAVSTLRFLFPDAHFINNHTGSRFTADAAAMARLYEAFKRYDFSFIDSKTTAHSTVRRIAAQYGDIYLARDIFLDNRKSPAYIRAQLRKAVRKAKRRGYAIAIGHPHPVTLQTLREAKDLLKGVRVVYIDELARSLR